MNFILKTTFVLLLLNIWVYSYAQQMNLDWLKSAGGSNWDMATDMAINDSTIIITGTFYNSITFNTDTLISKGDRDIYIARFNNEGKYLNSFSIGTTGFDYSYKVMLDEDASFYLALKVHHAIKIGNTVIDSLSRSNFVIAHLNYSGELINHFNYATTDKATFSDFCQNTKGDIFFTGVFEGTLFADNKMFESKDRDFYIGRISKNGKLKWMSTWGNDGKDDAFNLAKGKDNMIYLSGSTHKGCFGEKNTIPEIVDRKNHLFVAKFNEEGNLMEAVYPFYGSDFKTRGIVVNDSSIWISAMFKNNVTTSINKQISNGNYDILLLNSSLEKLKFDLNHFGGRGSDIPIQIVNSGKNLVFSGMYSGDLKIKDKILANDSLTNSLFVCTIDSKKNIDQIFNFTEGDYKTSSVIKATGSGIYLLGDFNYDLESSDKKVKSKGSQDVFIARYENCDAKNPLKIQIDSVLYGKDKYAYNFDAGGGFVNYLWDNNSDDRVFSTKKEGLYYVEVEDKFGCFYIDSVSINKFKSVLLSNYSFKTGSLKFYPTYTTGIVNFISNEDINTNSFTLKVTNTEGKVFYSEQFKGSISANRIFQIDVSTLSPAPYIVWVISDKGEHSSKIVVY